MSARGPVVHVCSFDALPRVTQRTTYESLRATAVEVGWFSVFEAAASPRAAKLFARLCRDPTVKTTPMDFPWTRVEREENTNAD